MSNRFIINERLSSKVYHFCDIDAFFGVCENNEFMLTPTSTNAIDRKLCTKGNYTYPYSMCFSRSSSSKQGYPLMRRNGKSGSTWRTCLVRMEIDGDKLNNLYKAHAVNYYEDIKLTEFEDRLLSRNGIIKNASQYIKRVDILVNKNIFNNKLMYNRLQMLYQIYFNNKIIPQNKIFIYNNENDFNKMSINGVLTKNSINNLVNSYKDGMDVNYKPKLTNPLLKSFVVAINLVCYGEQKNNAILSYLIDKYGFNEYKNEIYNLLNNQNENFDSMIGYIKMTQPNFKKYGFYKYGFNIIKMIQDYCKIYGLQFLEIVNFKKTVYRIINNERLTKKHLKYITLFKESKENNFFNDFLSI